MQLFLTCAGFKDHILSLAVLTDILFYTHPSPQKVVSPKYCFFCSAFSFLLLYTAETENTTVQSENDLIKKLWLRRKIPPEPTKPQALLLGKRLSETRKSLI